MDCINCCICGDSLDEAYTHKLKCNHVFHYECLLLSFKAMKNTSCPYGIHDMDGWETYENKKCLHVLERGKNKGKQCSKYCHIGKDYCLIHEKKHKELDEINNDINNNGNE